MSRFSIGIVGYDTRPHSRCFEDFARALGAALRQLEHEVVPTSDSKPGRLIMFGANNMVEEKGGPKIPEDAIVFNTEQVATAKSVTEFMENHAQYKKHVVWDYSETNAESLRNSGIERVVHCPVGYHYSMERMRAQNEDIDVLFYGSVNPRRADVLRALEATRLKVKIVAPPHHVYGNERDILIQRAKIVLNLHYYENGVFEIFRVSHLLANKKCVVSEAHGCDSALEKFASEVTMYCFPEKVAQVCQHLVHRPEERLKIAERGYDRFRMTSLVENVRHALELS